MTIGLRQSPAEAVVTELFAAQCAHDFNNLLTGILGNLELMQNRARRSGVSEFDGYIDGARGAAGRAADFAQRLLAYSGRAAQAAAPVRVDALVANLVEVAEERAAPLELVAQAGAAEVFCCPGQLETALRELLGNAREACAAGGAVRLVTAASAAAVTICVADTGCGMAADILAHAREPFFTSRTNGAGKGLGLAIADRVVCRYGGALEIDSQTGNGTIVTLTLPRHWPDAG